MASSRRSLGTGRVLGTPRAVPWSATSGSRSTSPGHPPIASPDSTPSIQTSSSVTPRDSSPDRNDITSAAGRHVTDAVATSSASNRFYCPICNEEMVTLLQLNRHLDTEHQDLENQEQDEVKAWFRSQMSKARKFQPFAVLNQKFKGLEGFESNEDPRTTPGNKQKIEVYPTQSTAGHMVQDAEENVTREHWQRRSRDGVCSDPLCERRLGKIEGNVNCRKCGKLFCEEHSMYQMKLSKAAEWDPASGFWCRVCETCYKSRKGYNDHDGSERNRIEQFSGFRRKAVDRSHLEASRLEKRLTKLVHALAEASQHEDHSVMSYLKLISASQSTRRQIEQSVVDWQENASIIFCPLCQQEFTNYSFKRHHCRLCGRIICADTATRCSTEVTLDVAGNRQTVDIPQKVSVNVRMCRDCKRSIFSKTDLAEELAQIPPDHRSFLNLKEFERGIRTLLPRFQKLLLALQDSDQPPSLAQINQATKVRKRLTDSFSHLSAAAQRIRDLETTSSTQTRLQQQVFAQASNFLHVHMLPLKSLPKTLKHASASGHHPRLQQCIKGRLKPNGTAAKPAHSPSGSLDSVSVLSSLEGEEKELRERLIVLEEQKVMVNDMLTEAVRRRQFEEVASLRQNVEDLNIESDAVQNQLETVNREFEGVYGTGAVTS